MPVKVKTSYQIFFDGLQYHSSRAFGYILNAIDIIHARGAIVTLDPET